MFAEFKRSYPDVGITVKRSETREVLEAVIDNSADFGVAAMPVTDKRITAVPIHKDELMLITPTGHPLARYKEIKISQIADYPLLLPKMGRTRDSIDRMFDDRDMKPNVSMELDSSELLKRFVSAGVGIGFCPNSTALGDVRLGITHDRQTCRRPDSPRHGPGVPQRQGSEPRILAFIDIAVRLKTPQSVRK